jgi:Arc/MetJ-type ribon-helix-helix transcriptional regulator
VPVALSPASPYTARLTTTLPAGTDTTSGCDSGWARLGAGGPDPGYTSGMKTAVSIPDDLFRQADELARRLGKSRSEVYREALADYVSRREAGAVTRALDEIADELAGDGAEFAAEAARRTLEHSEW